MISFRGGINLKDLYSAVATVFAGCRITYLLDVVFNDYPNTAAPVASPLVGRKSELTLVQTDGQFSIVDGQLNFPAQTTPVWGDQGWYDATVRARIAGLTLYAQLEETTENPIYFAGFNDNASVINDLDGASFYNSGGTQQLIYGGIAANIGFPLGGVMRYTDVLRNGGAFFFLKGDTALNWTLVWIGNIGPLTALYTRMVNSEAVGKYDMFRCASLADNATCPTPELGVRDLDLSVPGTGNGTSSIAVPISGNTYMHTPDVILEFDLVSLPTAGSILVDWRRQDVNNTWRVALSSTSDMVLYERVGGGNLVRANAPGVLTNGDHITIIANDTTITGFYDDTQAWQYTSATNFLTETEGGIASLGFPIVGVLNNLEARTLDGIANVTSSNHPGYGVATDVLPGPRAAADTFTHEADCILEFMLPVIPTGGLLEFWFRAATVGTDGWRVTVEAAGDVELDEVVAAAVTQRGISAGAVAGGERIIIIAEGDTIKVYVDTTLAITYAAAATQNTQTAGELEALGVAGEVSNIITWPRTLAAAPNTPGANGINAAFNRMSIP